MGRRLRNGRFEPFASGKVFGYVNRLALVRSGPPYGRAVVEWNRHQTRFAVGRRLRNGRFEPFASGKVFGYVNRLALVRSGPPYGRCSVM